jgi:hypothetical protein
LNKKAVWSTSTISSGQVVDINNQVSLDYRLSPRNDGVGLLTVFTKILIQINPFRIHHIDEINFLFSRSGFDLFFACNRFNNIKKSFIINN